VVGTCTAYPRNTIAGRPAHRLRHRSGGGGVRRRGPSLGRRASPTVRAGHRRSVGGPWHGLISILWWSAPPGITLPPRPLRLKGERLERRHRQRRQPPDLEHRQAALPARPRKPRSANRAVDPHRARPAQHPRPADHRARREARSLSRLQRHRAPARKRARTVDRPCRVHHRQRPHALIQPYLASIDTDGETALLYFDGQFSHAVCKAAILKPGADLVEGLFAMEAITPRNPSEASWPSRKGRWPPYPAVRCPLCPRGPAAFRRQPHRPRACRAVDVRAVCRGLSPAVR